MKHRKFRSWTLEEILRLVVDGDALKGPLVEAGVPSSQLDYDKRPIARRRWSKLEPFDRRTFDYDAYLKSLDT